MERKVKVEVLAVDNHCLILGSISKIVDKMPDAIVTNAATSGRAALELIGRHNYDVCILNVSMPDISGFDLITEIRKRNENARIIVYTTHEEIWIINRLDTIQNFVQMETGFSCKFVLISEFRFQK